MKNSHSQDMKEPDPLTRWTSVPGYILKKSRNLKAELTQVPEEGRGNREKENGE